MFVCKLPLRTEGRRAFFFFLYYSFPLNLVYEIHHNVEKVMEVLQNPQLYLCLYCRAREEGLNATLCSQCRAALLY